MTAQDARSSLYHRQRIATWILEHHSVAVADRLIVAMLDGYRTRTGTMTLFAMACDACGVDVKTVPPRTDEEIARWKARNKPKPGACKDCADKDATIESLRAQLAVSEEHLASVADQNQVLRLEARARTDSREVMRELERLRAQLAAETARADAAERKRLRIVGATPEVQAAIDEAGKASA